jgi:hypothetical protein
MRSARQLMRSISRTKRTMVLRVSTTFLYSIADISRTSNEAGAERVVLERKEGEG